MSSAIMKKKVLFVCTANLQRSPTAEDRFRDWKGVWETKSAGTDPVSGGIPLTQEAIDWADLVVCMESEHVDYIKAQFKYAPAKLKVLNITDRYFRDDPDLVRELDRKVIPLLNG
jgi:predicted protein tyrosine phosphatase